MVRFSETVLYFIGCIQVLRLNTLQDSHGSDPEEFYVKQDRIGAPNLNAVL